MLYGFVSSGRDMSLHKCTRMRKSVDERAFEAEPRLFSTTHPVLPRLLERVCQMDHQKNIQENILVNKQTLFAWSLVCALDHAYFGYTGHVDKRKCGVEYLRSVKRRNK